MARPLLVGVQLPEVEYEVGWPELISMARTAEAVGFDSIWLGDHLLYDLEAGPRGPWEVWTSLSVLAAVTSQVQLGPLVAATAFHAPGVLAKLAATVEAVSDGRLILGLGAGWNAREFSAFGFPYDRRVSRFDEAFTIIRELVRTGRCTFSGQYHSVEDCVIHPRGPRDHGPPILVGSIGTRMLHLTLPYVDLWNAWWSDYGNTPAGFAARSRQVDAICAEIGRDPAEVGRTCAVLVQLEGGVGRQMGDYEGRGSVPVSGSASQIADTIAGFAHAGAHHVQLVVDPITEASVEALGEVLEVLDGC
jgi:alkanesulfonate monooxygenase SsuD/methylene tetrahydromethanopterin reductase-like flavin-dependent oxidoreductase (luciferase family)